MIKMKIPIRRKVKGNVKEDLGNGEMKIGSLRKWLEVNQQFELLDALDKTLNEIWEKLN